MKKLLSTLCACGLCCLTVLVLTITTADAGPQAKVCICHHPPGNPSNAHTICVGPGAAKAHMKHGDTEGPCPVLCDSNDDCGTNQFCKRTDDACSEDSDGVCTNFPAACPTSVIPVCGCDGVTYNNACEANAACVNVASEGACAGAACGGAAGDTCTDTQFCKTDTGACDPSAEGECFNLPAVCPTTFDPVCGCDGETYSNACTADGAGVNIAAAGECADGVGVACGGEAGDTCADTEFCKLADGACSPDAEGVCTVIPGACPSTYIPVCGCDGETHSNACFAASNGTSVAAAGVCEEGTACTVGDGTCAEGEFCRPDVGDCAAAAPGTCTALPGVCPLNFFPVCGCDGVTYSNPCSAYSAGTGIAAEGECDVDQQACSGTVACTEPEVCIRPMGECAPETEGVCQPIPVVCTANVDPVCGCDGITYSNACVANSAGVTVASAGECEPPVEPVACDGPSGGTCAEGEFCKHADGACAADAEGTCVALPLACQPIVLEVCGCDGITYPSACFANGNSVNVNTPGACTPTP